jgi:hypothetical protein
MRPRRWRGRPGGDVTLDEVGARPPLAALTLRHGYDTGHWTDAARLRKIYPHYTVHPGSFNRSQEGQTSYRTLCYRIASLNKVATIPYRFHISTPTGKTTSSHWVDRQQLDTRDRGDSRTPRPRTHLPHLHRLSSANDRRTLGFGVA